MAFRPQSGLAGSAGQLWDAEEGGGDESDLCSQSNFQNGGPVGKWGQKQPGGPRPLHRAQLLWLWMHELSYPT